MAQYVIIAQKVTGAVTFLYKDAGKALRKVRTLQRSGVPFELEDGETNLSLTVAELETLSGTGA